MLLDLTYDEEENPGMRDLDKTYQLTTPSLYEIDLGIKHDAAPSLGLRGVRFRRRKLRPGPLINAIVLEFLLASDDEQEARVRKGIEKLEFLMSCEEPQKLEHLRDLPKTVESSQSALPPQKAPKGRRRA